MDNFVDFDTFYITKRYEFMGLPTGGKEDSATDDDIDASGPVEEMWVDWS